MLVGSARYATGNFYARRTMKGVPVAVSTVGQNIAGLVLVLPFAVFALPDAVPPLPVLGSLAGLGAIGTGFSLLLYFRLIANVGPARPALRPLLTWCRCGRCCMELCCSGKTSPHGRFWGSP